MGKLADFLVMKRDLAFDYERELRAVRNLILGMTRISGTEYTIDLACNEGFVAGSAARKAFADALRASAHDALVNYAHDLARECLKHGLDEEVIGEALAGAAARAALAANAEPSSVVRLASRA